MTINTFKILKANKLKINLEDKYCIYYNRDKVYGIIVLNILFIIFILSYSFVYQYFNALFFLLIPILYLVIHINKLLLKQPILYIDSSKKTLYNFEKIKEYSLNTINYKKSIRNFGKLRLQMEILEIKSKNNRFVSLFTIKYFFIKDRELVHKYMKSIYPQESSFFS